VMQDCRNVGGRVGLGKAAEILSAGKGHRALVAAQQLIEDAARLNAISIVGDQEYGGTWQPETLSAEDSQDVIFDWPVVGESVAAEPISPSLGLSRYRNLTMAVADVEKLASVFDEWFAASKHDRADLASRWWTNPSHDILQQPAEEDRFPLPSWAEEFGLVSKIAEHRQIPLRAALTILGHTLKAIIRTRVMTDDDREFLARVVTKPRTDPTLIRLRLLVRNIMIAELTGAPESRFRVLRLFDPDLPDVERDSAALQEVARAAIFAPDTPTKPMPETDSPLGGDVDTPNRRGKSGPRPPAGRDEAIRKRLKRGEIPGRTVFWSEFCDGVRDDAYGWKDKREGTITRGFDDKTIQNVVGKMLDNPDGQI
jgi:hypothetical protein